ncbi:hypothetical protein EYF80_052947 [Liparis tanakae]|uniref:Uncharacterized protein n=1 Tax=Liparis tanakae TaxID=230148 RepID=A0A4Z2F7U4_9TELE|nr:hypothetical protein EYF80_052947 [Liparis tanakae]
MKPKPSCIKSMVVRMASCGTTTTSLCSQAVHHVEQLEEVHQDHGVGRGVQALQLHLGQRQRKVDQTLRRKHEGSPRMLQSAERTLMNPCSRALPRDREPKTKLRPQEVQNKFHMWPPEGAMRPLETDVDSLPSEISCGIKGQLLRGGVPRAPVEEDAEQHGDEEGGRRQLQEVAVDVGEVDALVQRARHGQRARRHGPETCRPQSALNTHGEQGLKQVEQHLERDPEEHEAERPGVPEGLGGGQRGGEVGQTGVLQVDLQNQEENPGRQEEQPEVHAWGRESSGVVGGAAAALLASFSSGRCGLASAGLASPSSFLRRRLLRLHRSLAFLKHKKIKVKRLHRARGSRGKHRVLHAVRHAIDEV